MEYYSKNKDSLLKDPRYCPCHFQVAIAVLILLQAFPIQACSNFLHKGILLTKLGSLIYNF